MRVNRDVLSGGDHHENSTIFNILNTFQRNISTDFNKIDKTIAFLLPYEFQIHRLRTFK